MKQHNEIINADLYLRSVSQVIGASYVRSNSLRQLVYETYGNSSISEATKLNIFIDLASVLHGLYSEHHRITIENVTDSPNNHTRFVVFKKKDDCYELKGCQLWNMSYDDLKVIVSNNTHSLHLKLLSNLTRASIVQSSLK